MKLIKTQMADPCTEEGAMDILRMNSDLAISPVEIQATAIADELGLDPSQIDYAMECDEDYYD
jgi:hypothetical protein